MVNEAIVEMRMGLHSLTTGMQEINANIEKIVKVSEILSDKVNVLEKDLSERVTRKKIYMSLLSFYPVLMIILMSVTSLDHQEIAKIAKNINTVFSATEQVMVAEENRKTGEKG